MRCLLSKDGDLFALMHFAGHVVAGVMTFALVAGSVGVLHLVTKWLVSIGVSVYLTGALVVIEYAIFGLDVLLMAVFLVTTAIKFVKEICK